MTKTHILLAGVAVLALGAGQGSARDAPSMLRASISSDITSATPGTKRDFNTDTVVLHMVEGLVAADEKGQPVPMLAAKVETSGDGRTYTFRLRDGVTFHNGAPLTSAEVVWSLERYMKPSTQWRCLPDLDGTSGVAKITGIAAPDARTVTVTLEKPAALFLATLARPDCGGTGILHPSSVKADGSWDKPVGTGPFKFGEWRSGQYVELERFADYAPLPGPVDGYAGHKEALVDAVRFVVIPDNSAAKTAMLAGDIDLMSSVAPGELPDLRARPDAVVVTGLSFGIDAYLFQTRDPVLKDVRIRKALALSLDMPQLVEAVASGDAPPNRSLVPTPSPFHGPAESRVPARDLAEARRLLAEAGYAGQPIRMITNQRYPSLYDAAIIGQAMAAEAGINIELEVLDWATQLDRYNSGNYQAMAFSYSARLDPSLTFDSVMGDKDTQPRKVWDDPKARELLARSMAETDTAKRQAIFDEMQGRLMQQVPMIVLSNEPEYTGVRKDVSGVRSWASGQLRLWGVSRT